MRGGRVRRCPDKSSLPRMHNPAAEFHHASVIGVPDPGDRAGIPCWRPFHTVGCAAGRSHRVHVLPLGGGQSLVISASRMTGASLPPNVEENTVMPAKLYSGGASFISLCIVPVRFVASRM